MYKQMIFNNHQNKIFKKLFLLHLIFGKEVLEKNLKILDEDTFCLFLVGCLST
jgi:hypothetical protein